MGSATAGVALHRVRRDERHSETVVTVPSTRLDTLLRTHGLQEIDYLSLDVEGAERTALRCADVDEFDITALSIENNRPGRESYVNVSLAEGVDAWLAAHYLMGSADVSAATGGGGIAARGLGPSAGIRWDGASNYYVAGGYALTVYDIDVSSSTRGLLEEGGAGYGQSADVRMGRRIGWGENVNLSPRAWAAGSRVEVDEFTDAVNARVSLPVANRVTGGAGAVADVAHAWDDGSVSVRASVDLERTLGGAQTVTLVSGERLSLEAAKNSVLLGVSAVYRQGRVSLGATAWLREVLDSNAKEYSGLLTLGIQL